MDTNPDFTDEVEASGLYPTCCDLAKFARHFFVFQNTF